MCTKTYKTANECSRIMKIDTGKPYQTFEMSAMLVAQIVFPTWRTKFKHSDVAEFEDFCALHENWNY